MKKNFYTLVSYFSFLACVLWFQCFMSTTIVSLHVTNNGFDHSSLTLATNTKTEEDEGKCLICKLSLEEKGNLDLIMDKKYKNFHRYHYNCINQQIKEMLDKVLSLFEQNKMNNPCPEKHLYIIEKKIYTNQIKLLEILKQLKVLLHSPSETYTEDSSLNVQRQEISKMEGFIHNLKQQQPIIMKTNEKISCKVTELSSKYQNMDSTNGIRKALQSIANFVEEWEAMWEFMSKSIDAMKYDVVSKMPSCIIDHARQIAKLQLLVISNQEDTAKAIDRIKYEIDHIEILDQVLLVYEQNKMDSGNPIQNYFEFEKNLYESRLQIIEYVKKQKNNVLLDPSELLKFSSLKQQRREIKIYRKDLQKQQETIIETKEKISREITSLSDKCLNMDGMSEITGTLQAIKMYVEEWQATTQLIEKSIGALLYDISDVLMGAGRIHRARLMVHLYGLTISHEQHVTKALDQIKYEIAAIGDNLFNKILSVFEQNKRSSPSYVQNSYQFEKKIYENQLEIIKYIKEQRITVHTASEKYVKVSLQEFDPQRNELRDLILDLLYQQNDISETMKKISRRLTGISHICSNIEVTNEINEELQYVNKYENEGKAITNLMCKSLVSMAQTIRQTIYDVSEGAGQVLLATHIANLHRLVISYQKDVTKAIDDIKNQIEAIAGKKTVEKIFEPEFKLDLLFHTNLTLEYFKNLNNADVPQQFQNIRIQIIEHLQNVIEIGIPEIFLPLSQRFKLISIITSTVMNPQIKLVHSKNDMTQKFNTEINQRINEILGKQEVPQLSVVDVEAQKFEQVQLKVNRILFYVAISTNVIEKNMQYFMNDNSFLSHLIMLQDTIISSQEYIVHSLQSMKNEICKEQQEESH